SRPGRRSGALDRLLPDASAFSRPAQALPVGRHRALPQHRPVARRDARGGGRGAGSVRRHGLDACGRLAAQRTAIRASLRPGDESGMSGRVFTINFRREMFERELARSRRRIVHLAAWMGYFGVFGLLVWTYVLNLQGMQRHTRMIQRQTDQFVAAQNLPRKVPLDASQIAAIERFHESPRRWRDKLARLATLVPPNGSLKSIGLNSSGSNQAGDQNRLVITGLLRAEGGDDPMRGVVQLVAALQSDSSFSVGYKSIKLSQ